jgi:hypothetical protein
MKTKRDLIDHLLLIIDDLKNSVEEDLMYVNKTSLKIIADMQTIIYLTDEKSTKRIKEPDFKTLELQLTFLKTKFHAAFVKKEVMEKIRDWGYDLISSLDDE